MKQLIPATSHLSIGSKRDYINVFKPFTWILLMANVVDVVVNPTERHCLSKF
jgi:hypothetical protein